MKKQDFFYLFLSLVLLALSGYMYVTYGKSHMVTPSKPAVKRVVKEETKESTPAPEVVEEDPLEVFSKKLDEIEQQPTVAALETLRPELEQLRAGTQRDAIVSRFDYLLVEATHIQEAELALQATTAVPNEANIAYTQELINKIQLPGQRQLLQDRLNALASGLLSSDAPSEEASIAAVAQGAISTGGRSAGQTSVSVARPGSTVAPVSGAETATPTLEVISDTLPVTTDSAPLPADSGVSDAGSDSVDGG